MTTRWRLDLPGQAHRADPELLLDRGVQRLVVLGVGRGQRGHRGVAAAAAQHLVEQLVDPLGEDRDLRLLQRRR